MTAPTIAEQTGWHRPHPAMMLQGFDGALDLLQQVSAYDFNLDDPRFQFYCHQRGLLFYAGAEGSDFWQWCRLAGQAGHLDGITDQELQENGGGQRLRIACARLQDAWELYRTNSDLTADILRLYVPRMGAPGPVESAGMDDLPSGREMIAATEPSDPPAPKPVSGQMDLFSL